MEGERKGKEETNNYIINLKYYFKNMLDNKIISGILLTSLACQGNTEEKME